MTMKTILGSLIAALILLGAPVAFAHDDREDRDHRDGKFNMGLHLGQIFWGDRGDKDKDDDHDKDTHERKLFPRTVGSTTLAAGTVATVTGSTFTLAPIGA